MSYLGANEVVPHYGLIRPVKAALESLVRYMAMEVKACESMRYRQALFVPAPASGIESF
jgi:enoyl-[acyl-carrier protein] reductase I